MARLLAVTFAAAKVTTLGVFDILQDLVTTATGYSYVLIGGLAAIMWGSDYITRDVDVCYARNDENLRKARVPH